MMRGADLAMGMPTSTGAQQAYEASDLAAVPGRAIRPNSSVPALIAQAAEMQKYAADRAMSLDAFAGRALDIATRLTGSIQAPGRDQQSSMNAEKMADPPSALDALQQTIVGIRRPLSAMDEPFGRLAAALDAIERALN